MAWRGLATDRGAGNALNMDGLLDLHEAAFSQHHSRLPYCVGSCAAQSQHACAGNGTVGNTGGGQLDRADPCSQVGLCC